MSQIHDKYQRSKVLQDLFYNKKTWKKTFVISKGPYKTQLYTLEMKLKQLVHEGLK